MTTMSDLPEFGCWLSAPDVVFIEMAADIGYKTLVLDVEHGTLSLADLDKLIPLARALGLTVLVKVTGPQAEPIQQALDFGADAVVIPHIGTAAHAAAICRAAKYPLLGTRSYAGARHVRYGVPSEHYFDADNRRTACYPMIETAEALADVEAILALPTVDGVFVGPSDLSLTRGRGAYRFGTDDQADIARIAAACAAAQKPWIMPAWTARERAFASTHGAKLQVIVEQQSAMASGMTATLTQARSDQRGHRTNAA
jgi:4-hydroxy-2-oxoheptanedioate aldolase